VKPLIGLITAVSTMFTLPVFAILVVVAGLGISCLPPALPSRASARQI